VCLPYLLFALSSIELLPSVLVGQQEGHPACKRTEWWGAGLVICSDRGADLHIPKLMPLSLTISCSSKSNWFYLSGTSSPE